MFCIGLRERIGINLKKSLPEFHRGFLTKLEEIYKKNAFSLIISENNKATKKHKIPEIKRPIFSTRTVSYTHLDVYKRQVHK